MDHNVTALERAFQIAKSGDCKSVADLKKQLRKERLVRLIRRTQS